MTTRIIRIPALGQHRRAPRGFVVAALMDLQGRQAPFTGPAVTLALPAHMQASLSVLAAPGRTWAPRVYEHVAAAMMKYAVTA
jgi:hypothetical protein